ncbi:acyltransferase family protein [Methylomicrobium sp. Wu6]|uniref:acyltransferase family protein n=1 Tax=Methylomicrobium sp. Wu6 TaxID=3107928 RepID=UPI002DD69B15|nr:acyltransferase family protein [Methylomicrobium sp. Wu6]MEC4747070.1 acyltransferase family protein [Methylomicrobium sp. Wu6]
MARKPIHNSSDKFRIKELKAMDIKYRPEIDGLRALAIILVFLSHYVNLHGGFVGVDVFFVISGYLITSIIANQHQKSQFKISDFYKRRIKRIFPALITVLLSCFLFGWFSLLSSEYQNLALHISSGSIFLSNFLLLSEVGYFDVSSEFKPLLHLWSLSIEEQFYIIWPAVITLCIKLRFPIKKTLLVFIIVSFAFNLYEAEISKNADFYLPVTRFWELALGGILFGETFNKTSIRNQAIGNILPVLGTLLILSCLHFVDKSRNYPSWPALLPTLGAALIIISPKNNLFNKYVLGSKPLVAIGLISYPLYLWHWPIISFLRIISEETSIKSWLKIVATLLSFTLAYLTYRFIETPLRFSAKPYTLWGLISTMALTGSLGYYTYHNNGFAGRFPDAEANAKQFKLMSQGNLNAIKKIDCSKFSIQTGDIACFISNPQLKPTLIAIGDSHAVHNTMGLIDDFNKLNQNFSIIYQGGCLPYINVQVFRGETETCSKSMQQALDFSIQTQEIKTVLLASRGSWYINGKDFQSKLNGFKIGILGNDSIQDSTEIYYQGLRNTVSKLLSSGKNVILVVDNPELGFNPKHCAKTRPFNIVDNFNAECAQSIHDLDENDKAYKSIIQKVITEFPAMKVFDTKKYLCDTEKCYAKINNNILYSDKNHLSAAGSAFIGEKFLHDIEF